MWAGLGKKESHAVRLDKEAVDTNRASTPRLPSVFTG